VQGTPTFFVNEELVEGVDFDTLKVAIDKAMK
jgi:protein-disulfide isomerase